jgi:spermidine synthase
VNTELPPVTLSEHEGVRYLHLGTIWVQGAMRIKDPQYVELDYIQRMLASLLWLPTPAIGQGQALQLGLGAGAITRFTLGALGMRTTVVELNSLVVRVCRHWFDVKTEDRKLKMVTADAGVWLREKAVAGSVQLLHVDLYDHEAAAPVLDDVAFYADCRRVLAEDGVMSVNLFGRHASFKHSAAQVAAVFGAAQVWSLRPTREGNTTLIATRSLPLPPADELARRAADIEARFGALGVMAKKWPRMLRLYEAHESAPASEIEASAVPVSKARA